MKNGGDVSGDRGFHICAILQCESNLWGLSVALDLKYSSEVCTRVKD